MAIKTYKSYTPSRRYITGLSSEDITAKPSVRSLLVKLPTHTGRNSYERIISHHKEAGARKFYRIIDFKRRKFSIEGKVETIEYDPYGSCRIVLTSCRDDGKRYILQPRGLSVGDIVAATESGLDVKPGSTIKLKNIPVGTVVRDIELKPGKGDQMIHLTEAYARLMGKEGEYVILRFAGGEMRQVLAEYMASMGKVGNEEWANVTIGKASRDRHRGVRLQTHGSVVNPVGHSYGRGEDKKNSGRHPVTPWGKPTKGAETRRKKANDKLIISRRKGK